MFWYIQHDVLRIAVQYVAISKVTNRTTRGSYA